MLSTLEFQYKYSHGHLDVKMRVLLRYNSLPCGTECFIGCREASRPTSKKKRHLLLAVASGCHHMICPFVTTFLVGRRHLTIFGKYLLPFSFYISVQCYYVHPPGGWIYYFCFFRRPMSGVTHGFRSFKGKVLELLSPNLVCRLIGSVACLGLLLAVVPLAY